MGSPQDSTWRDFPLALEEMQGARWYVTLFEAPFVASELEGRESQALRAGSLMAIPPLPPGFQPLPGVSVVDLTGHNLAQWADCVQEVTSHMRLPPQAAVECPMLDIVSVLDRLEGMTRVRYCRFCFGVGQQCRCLAVPRQVPGPMAPLWMPPAASYMAMASCTETTASTSIVGVTPLSHQTSRLPPPEAMDTMPPPSTENLLLTAGVGRGIGGRTPPRTPTAPGPHQASLRMPHLQVPTPGRQEATSSTPYWQQVFPPQTAAPRQGATPSAAQSQGHERLAGDETGARGRSLSGGSRDG